MAKQQKVVVESKTDKDDLAELLSVELNKANKSGGKIAYFLDDKEDPSTITDWISTGSTMLDLAISNRPHGGLPVGRISTLTGLEGCVTEDTKIKVMVDERPEIIVDIKEIYKFINNMGLSVYVKTKDNKYARITDYVDKGLLDTYEVILYNGFTIKVSREHKFYTADGWVECKDLEVGNHCILCEDGGYSVVTCKNFIGKYKIVDITVDHPDHCYFGNGMLNHNTGKSLLCAHIVANTQKKGGVAVYIDTEASAAPEFWTALGVNLKTMVYMQQDTIEGAFQNIENIIGMVRKSDSNRLCTIILDSIAGASTKMELEANYDRKGFATGKSLIVSEAMRKLTNLIAKQRILLVMTNQLRQNLQASAWGDKWVEPCGKSTSFHSSVKVRFETIEKLKDSDKQVIGTNTRATVRKNRMGPPFRSAEFCVYFSSGIADYASWIDLAKKKKIVDGPSNRISYDEQLFTTEEFINKLNIDSNFKESFYNKICDSVIMQYKTPNSIILENIITESEEGKVDVVVEED